MKKEQRIKTNKEFSQVFNNGNSVANRQFVLYTLPKQGQDYFRLGLSVSKKVGNAVTRNQVKRYIREVFRLKEEVVLAGNDYIVIARKPAATMDFFEVEKSLLHVLKKARVLKK
ncbi:ribonuclease P protein component [Halalkalibacter akibai]|uniref:Ribonuclease P protein component n=1 Tax=Halalkalibacter akibai (strain ATCC 43226 / DSM 21942 / CIP 109018 / JCM 9157 / 1139) TaxID=1236973 RepID=W4QQP8_HALA3|nr:ribonuclease P protein component [Halalkalibacter akibai]GAE34410.1 ribonuclease P protein component [Halalkalibacter akibai JCM 9157]